MKFCFISPIVLEGTWGAKSLSEQEYSEVESITDSQNIEVALHWEIPGLLREEVVGLEIHGLFNPILQGYDGVMSLPAFAIRFCQSRGINVDEIAETEPPQDEHIKYGWELIKHLPHTETESPESWWWQVVDNKFEPTTPRDLEKHPMLE